MPISVKKDIKKAYGFGDRFFLGDTHTLDTSTGLQGGAVFKIREFGGTYLKHVKPVIADQNWKEFHNASGLTALSVELGLSLALINVPGLISIAVWNTASRDVARTVSMKFNLNENEKTTFNKLWKLNEDALNYAKEKKVKDDMDKDLQESYRLLAKIAAGKATNKEFDKKPTFKRQVTREDSLFVVFSDFHMTAYPNKPNYFSDYNYKLYVDVLRSYYATHGYCVIENGDVEETVITEFTLEDAKDREKTAAGGGQFPIDPANDKWNAFLDVRYQQRLSNLDAIRKKYQDYYSVIRDKFISKGKYVRLTGNHDTYLDGEREGDLKEKIETELNSKLDPNASDFRQKKISIADVLTITRNGKVKYVVLHGHQFDHSCLQHGKVPYAKSLGEVYSECLAWCNEGADRVWGTDDTSRWYIGNTPTDANVTKKGNYLNVLAEEEPKPYENGTDGQFDLLYGNTDQIKQDPVGFFETLLTTEIGWEYFENSNEFNAFTLEVWTGDEGYKQRHLNEIALCEKYKEKYLVEAEIPKGSLIYDIPKVIIGHTHEPRQNSLKAKGDPPSSAYHWYLNSGSAGRYENLIWCVEVFADVEKIVSWSNVDGKLKKIVWKSDGDKLIHDPDIGYQVFDIVG